MVQVLKIITDTAGKYFNSSTGGDNTIKVEKEDRIFKKLYPTDPDIVYEGPLLVKINRECHP